MRGQAEAFKAKQAEKGGFVCNMAGRVWRQLKVDAELLCPCGALALVEVLFGDPEVVSVLHHIGQHSASQEHHVLAARRILNANLELGQTRRVALPSTGIEYQSWSMEIAMKSMT